MEEFIVFRLSALTVSCEPSATVLLAEAVCVDWCTERGDLVCDQLSCAAGASAKTVR